MKIRSLKVNSSFKSSVSPMIEKIKSRKVMPKKTSKVITRVLTIMCLEKMPTKLTIIK